MSSRVLSIVFTDIKGFTERTSQSDREFAVRLRKKHDELLKPIIALYGGKLIKTIGDAFLLTYESPTNAVLCAMMMQQTLRQHNAGVPQEERIEIRVSINTGEVQIQDTDILGEPVNVASRLEGITEVNEVWFTEATYLAMNKQEVPTSFIGEFRFKGIPEGQKIYRAIIDPDSEFFKKMLSAQSQRSAPEDLSQTATPAPTVSLSFGRGTLVLLLVLGLVLFGAYQANRWTRLKTLLEKIPTQTREAKFLGARNDLTELLQIDPESAPGRRFAEEWTLSLVRSELQANGLASGTAALADSYSRFPFLQPHHLGEAEVKVAQAFSLVEKGSKFEAMAIVDKLEKENAKSFDIVRLVAHFYDQTGIHWYKCLTTMEAAYRLAPEKMASDPAFLEWTAYFLKQVTTEDDIPSYRQLIREKFLPLFRPTLEQALYDPDPEKATLRRNARDFLTTASPAVSVDLFRFHLCDLAEPWPSLYDARTAVVSEYFLASDFNFPKATGATDRAWISSMSTLLESVHQKAEEAYGEDARRNGLNATATRRLEALKKAGQVLRSCL